MEKLKKHSIIGFLVMTICIISSSMASATVYVKADSPALSLDGKSWDTAFHTIKDGLKAAVSGEEVWVAQGVYTENVVLKPGVTLKGGYLGEGDIRDPKAYETIITPGASAYPANYTVTGVRDAVIDGFTIHTAQWAAVGCYMCSPTVTNNKIIGSAYGFELNGASPTISDNFISVGCDGIIATYGSSPRITNNDITGEKYSGITIRYSSSPQVTNNKIAGRDGIWISYSCNPVVEGNTITSTGTLPGNGIYSAYQSSPVIADNIVIGNGKGTGISVVGPATKDITGNMVADFSQGIAVSRDCSLAVSNNVILRSTSAGICTMYGGNINITNNTIVGNGTGSGIRYDASVNQRVQNNIITCTSTGIIDIFSGYGRPILYNNNLYGNTRNYNGVTPGPTDISVDPQFVDPGAGDFHLQGTSMCIDAGTNANAPILDFDGNTRPFDGNADGLAVTDIGAYEHTPIRVCIDVFPDNPNNVINLKSNKQITVAVLSDSTFDAGTIDPLSVVFGRNLAVEVHGRGHLEDANGDGITDMVLHFQCGDIGIAVGDESVSLRGKLDNGQWIVGSDKIFVR